MKWFVLILMYLRHFIAHKKMKIILILTLLPFCYGSLCPKGEYWSTFSEICLKCTQCKPHQIVIRTCQSHKDTLCSTSAKIFKHNSLDSNSNNKKVHHFEKGKLHVITDEDPEEVLNNGLLEMDIKHDNSHNHHNKKHKNVKKQRINDKFLKWDEDDYDYDYDYEVKKHNKHKDHKSSSKPKHHTYNKEKHHYSFSDPSVDLDDDYDEYEDNNDLETILDKKSKKWKEEKAQKNKNAARLAQLEDERKLEEWLIQSRKQFKDRKDNLLKTLKEEQMSSYGSDKRIRLNYPLLNSKDRYSDSIKYDTDNNNNNDKVKSKTQKKHNMESEVDLFKELIKNEESQEMELATLMSNKKESPFHYKTVTPSHRMFLGAPSDMTGHIKDPQEVIKEEMGRNIIYEKSKFSVVPIITNDKGEGIVPVPFTAAERLVWDWQAVAVVSAIASCLLFFLVIGVFILFNARHWRTDKHPYSPESEEMSTRVALIQPTLEARTPEGNNKSRFSPHFMSLKGDTVKEDIRPDIINKK